MARDNPYTGIGLAAFLTVTMSQSALAADWHYCLAPSRAEHKIYISEPFPTGNLGSGDRAFERMLAESGIRHDEVQCPRADSEGNIAAMRQYAINFNQEYGNAVILVRFGQSR
jgi:hypothetical protein